MKGYKVFNPDWTCRDFQYEVGGVYEMEDTIKPCERGFHFCKKLIDCFSYYEFNPRNKVAEIVALGKVVEHGEDSKCCTDKIKIVKEMTWHEVLDLVNIGLGNTGVSNSGDRNSGDWNSGNLNSGDRNSGDWNSGNSNSGDRNSGNLNSGNLNSGNLNSGNSNSGDWNSGNLNSGNLNSGNLNSGNSNSGDWNSGDWNSGNSNSGDRNSGDWNSGNLNSGNSNSGDRNSGDRNSGNLNSGNLNSGDRNSGDWNSGIFNSTDYSSGVFCSKPEKIRIFNAPSDMTIKEFYISRFYKAICSAPFNLTEWVYYTECEIDTDAKKATGGYLGVKTYKEACADWWSKMSEENKEIIKSMPNFDPKVFEEITGIKV